MENIKAEVNGKIRSAIKAKLMELGVYVDEELPDYIMVMVVNKRTKLQMEDDLQLFLGTNTEHFTIWLHQVLQKLEEVTSLDKKTPKQTTSSVPETAERKRKTSTGSLDSDGHRKEKRRKSHEGKKSKKNVGDPDKGKEQKKDADSSDFLLAEGSGVSKENKESLVSSSVDVNKIQDVQESPQKMTLEGTSIKAGVVSSSSSPVDDSVADDENRALVPEGTDDEVQHTETTVAPNVTSTLTQGVATQSTAKTKIVLMHSDDEDDDDEDFINIKADAEAEALLNEELPKESDVDASESVTSPVTEPAIDLEEKITDENTSELENLEIPVGTFDRKKSSTQLETSNTLLSERFTRKRKVEKEFEMEENRVTPVTKNRLITSALSIKERLGIKKPESTGRTGRIQDRLGQRAIPVEILRNRRMPPIILSPNARNSSQVIEKSLRDRISRRAPEGVSFQNDSNQDQRKRPILSRVVLPQPGRIEEEYDPANPAVGTVASIVRVKPRPRIPAELQANKNLLLKAVAEAQKSVANIPIRPEPLSPSRKRLTDNVLARRARAANIAITLPNRRGQSSSSFNSQKRDAESERMMLPAPRSREKLMIQVSTDSIQTKSNVRQNKPELLSVDAEHQLNHSLEEDEDELLPDEGIVTEELDNEDDVPAVYPPVGLASRMPRDSKPQPPRCESPQFLVTLDGLDPSMFPSHSDEDQCSPVKPEEEEDEHDDNSSKMSGEPSSVLKDKGSRSPIVFTKRDTPNESDSNLPKSLERCKYWPSCRSGTKCTFHHPNTPCKSFPKCQLREKCLHIHPMCKFDSSCTRRDCPFMHMTFSALLSPLTSASRLKSRTLAPNPASSQVCRFFPKCTNALCQYLHPKPCRYGKFCSKPNCNYLHDELPPVDKLKWTSPFRT